MVTPAGYREAAGHLQAAYEMSERRACRVLGVDRTSVRYQATRPDDGALRDRLKALAQERRRFGYRRLHVLLRRGARANVVLTAVHTNGFVCWRGPAFGAAVVAEEIGDFATHFLDGGS